MVHQAVLVVVHQAVLVVVHQAVLVVVRQAALVVVHQEVQVAERRIKGLWGIFRPALMNLLSEIQVNCSIAGL